MTTRDTGKQAEQLACDYLVKQGLSLVTRNYHSRRGEIDLIMAEGNILVFIEVRFRRSTRFGSALESVNREKMARIIATAQHYVQQHHNDGYQYRFDVVAVESLHSPQITWVRNAFQLD